MVVLWPNMKHEVSPCPGWHSKAKLVSEACKSDHKQDDMPVAYTNEVHKKGESREAMELADDTQEASDQQN